MMRKHNSTKVQQKCSTHACVVTLPPKTLLISPSLSFLQGNVLFGWLIVYHPITDSTDKFFQEHLNTFASL